MDDLISREDALERLTTSASFGYICFSIPAKDKEHAIKIARDMRFKYIAEKYGL